MYMPGLQQTIYPALQWWCVIRTTLIQSLYLLCHEDTRIFWFFQFWRGMELLGGSDGGQDWQLTVIVFLVLNHGTRLLKKPCWIHLCQLYPGTCNTSIFFSFTWHTHILAPVIHQNPSWVCLTHHWPKRAGQGCRRECEIVWDCLEYSPLTISPFPIRVWMMKIGQSFSCLWLSYLHYPLSLFVALLSTWILWEAKLPN